MRLPKSWVYVLVLIAPAAAAAQEPGPRTDPVDQLERALRAPARGAAARDAQLAAAVEHLRGLDELRRALLLTEWRDRDQDDGVAAADARQRAAVVRRFGGAVRAALRQGDLDGRLRAVQMIGGLDLALRGAGEGPLVRDFTDDLAGLTGPGPAALRQLAARTLGRINPEPGAAAAALGTLLNDADPGLRAVAAEALGGLVATAVSLDAAGDGRDPSHGDIVRVAAAAVPVAGRGLADAAAEVRRRCAEVLGQAADVLGALADDAAAPGEVEDWPAYQRQVENERVALRPLMAALLDQSAALARSAADADVRVRVASRRALEEVAQARWRLLRRAASAVAAPEGEGDRAAGDRSAGFLLDDPLMRGLQQALPALAAGVTDDAEPAGRRAAIDVLEALGRPAAPAAPALVRALADRDRFVRWAAARALGKVRPPNAETVVPALARLLAERDLDLGLAAVSALCAYGPGARAALPALAEAARAPEPEMRLAVLRALECVGGTDAASQAALGAALNDPDRRVRELAGEVLEKVGPPRRGAGGGGPR
jgi:HEAT repeat protein